MTHNVPTRFDLLIDGKVVTGEAASFDVINPATGVRFAEVLSASSTQVDFAIAAGLSRVGTNPSA
jgi:acyl-CoA reductase-like NAD-dependent aldehyde dehydrogenase